MSIRPQLPLGNEKEEKSLRRLLCIHFTMKWDTHAIKIYCFARVQWENYGCLLHEKAQVSKLDTREGVKCRNSLGG